MTSCHMPPGAWQQVFAADKHLPDLQELTVNAGPDSLPLTMAGVGRVVKCCPNLQALDGMPGGCGGVYSPAQFSRTTKPEIVT